MMCRTKILVERYLRSNRSTDRTARSITKNNLILKQHFGTEGEQVSVWTKI